MPDRNLPTTVAFAVNPALGERGEVFVSLPETEPTGPLPFVFAIHGGGWSGGDQHSYDWILPLLHSLGVAVVTPSYRPSGEAPFPAAFEDLLGVLRWVKDNSGGGHLDPERCLLFGGSAGGHLAMLLATRVEEFAASLPRFRGVVQYCGIMDTADQFEFDEGRGSAMTRNFLGGSPTEQPALYREASPIHHISPALPPVWMAHGSADACVPFRQMANFAAALRAAGHDPIVLEARGLGHTMVEIDTNGEALQPYRALFQNDLRRFIHRHLCQTAE